MSDPARIGPPAPQEPNTMLNIIARAAFDPNADVTKLQALLAMQERFEARELEREAREAMRAYNQAMGRAQAEMQPVVRKANNDQTNSKYAKLETIDQAIRPIYAEHGFNVSYGYGQPQAPGNVRVICKCSHEGGHTETFEMEAPLDIMGPYGKRNKTDLHGIGSTSSYLRRYLKTLIFDVVLVDEDDDGNGGKRDGNIADGMGENYRREPPPPPPSRPIRKVSEWIEKFEEDCREALGPEDAEAIKADPDVIRAGKFLRGAALDRYNTALNEMDARFFNPPDDQNGAAEPAPDA